MPELPFRARIQRPAGWLALCSTLALITACGDSKTADTGQSCKLENVRVETVEDYRPAVGRTLTFPADLRAWKIQGASGEIVTPSQGPATQQKLRLNVEGNITLTFPGPHDLEHMHSLAFIAWIAPKRPIDIVLHARKGDQVWSSAPIGYAQAGVGWELFRVPLPAEAVQAKQVDTLVLDLTGEVAGDLAIEQPVLEWVLAPPWKTLLEGDLTQPRAVKLSDGTRAAFGLVPGRVLRMRAKLPADGGQIKFASSSIEPARGKPTSAGFLITVHHADGRVGQHQAMLQTRNKWQETGATFQGKAGETVDIEIEFMVEGPAALCAAVTMPEVTVP